MAICTKSLTVGRLIVCFVVINMIIFCDIVAKWHITHFAFTILILKGSLFYPFWKWFSRKILVWFVLVFGIAKAKDRYYQEKY